ncbi:MAG: hypothetical protein AB7I37_26270 [Pirellulales bacterium]
MNDDIEKLIRNGWIVTFHLPGEQVAASCEYKHGDQLDGGESFGGFGSSPEAALSDCMSQMYKASFEGGAY